MRSASTSRSVSPSPTVSAKAPRGVQQADQAVGVFAKLGLVEGASGHLTIRDSLDPSAFWVTPFGKPFALMTASDLLLVDHHGKVCGGGKPDRQIYNS